MKKNPVMYIICGICLVLSLVAVILSFACDFELLPALAICLGCVEIIIGVVYFFIYRHKARYTCPACGTKRERHSEYLDSREAVNNNQYLYTIKLYHKYRYTYVCPNCGETLEEIKEESSGEYKLDHSNGRITDTRKSPHVDY